MSNRPTHIEQIEELRRACTALFHPGDIVELRQLGGSGGVASGYFDDLDALCEEAAEYDGKGGGLYVTINPVRPGEHTVDNVLRRSVKQTTADTDIESRRWLPIDLDPVRDSGVPATEEEGDAARARADEVEEFLNEVGWLQPVRADSGNGVHLLYRVDLPNDDTSRTLVETVLKTLNEQWSDDRVKIDTSMSNAARIVRLPGTLNMKGDETEDRCHRRSSLVSVPDPIEVVGEGALRLMTPQATKSLKWSSGDVAEWLEAHDLEIRKKKDGDSWSVYELQVCPFNEGHDRGEAYIVQFPDGGMHAGCHHNSCTWDWEDLVEKVDPGAFKEKGEKRSQQSQLVDLMLEDYEPVVSHEDHALAIPKLGPRVAYDLDSSILRQEVARRFWERHEIAPTKSSIDNAIMVVKGYAGNNSPQPIHLRAAKAENEIVVDLAQDEGKFVRITPDGWEISRQSPVLFRRTTLSLPLPEPERGGSLDDLKSLLNVSEEEFHLIVGWLVATIIPDIPHPILLLEGEQGSAKSTTAVMLRKLIDPSRAPTQHSPTTERDWVTAANHSYVVALDNVSGFTPSISNALCQAVTGEGWVARKLYSDSEPHVLSFRRVIIVTGIDLGKLRPDLVDRIMTVELKGIPRENRRTDQELDEHFRQLMPKLIGALYDLVSITLRHIPYVDVPDLPRMADYGKVLCALDTATDMHTFESYVRRHSEALRDIAANDTIAAKIIDFINAHASPVWKGSATELINEIGIDDPFSGATTDPSAFSKSLSHLTVPLRESGIEFERERDSGNRYIILRRTSEEL